jgi:hypothetical protein
VVETHVWLYWSLPQFQKGLRNHPCLTEQRPAHGFSRHGLLGGLYYLSDIDNFVEADHRGPPTFFP